MLKWIGDEGEEWNTEMIPNDWKINFAYLQKIEHTNCDNYRTSCLSSTGLTQK